MVSQPWPKKWPFKQKADRDNRHDSAPINLYLQTKITWWIWPLSRSGSRVALITCLRGICEFLGFIPLCFPWPQPPSYPPIPPNLPPSHPLMLFLHEAEPFDFTTSLYHKPWPWQPWVKWYPTKDSTAIYPVFFFLLPWEHRSLEWLRNSEQEFQSSVWKWTGTERRHVCWWPKA